MKFQITARHNQTGKKVTVATTARKFKNDIGQLTANGRYRIIRITKK